ncbi:MAG: hypothetical protein ACW99Q_28000 [Candidatus Kariarchaeaceae archaeon]|jgi:GTPase SAR1 family protein
MKTLNHYILVTGLMSSGKSTIINEYIRNFPWREFQKPPIEVKFQGLEFDLSDSAFSLEREDINYNFYELDAPTVQKWVEFIQMADAIVIVYNHAPKLRYGSHEDLSHAIFENRGGDVPVIFIINNFTNYEEAKSALIQKYRLSQRDNDRVIYLKIGKGKIYRDDKYGVRLALDKDSLESIFSEIIYSLAIR